MSKKRRKSGSCYNCQWPLTNGENYCPNCGQENHNRQASTRLLLVDFFNDYLSFDSKMFRTLIPLVLKPGFMTREFLDGKRMKYVPPIRLFIFLSFLYFGLIYLLGEEWIGKFTVNGSEPGSHNSERFLEIFRNNINLMIFAFTPIQALIFMPFFRSETKKYYVNFFVYTLHLYSFLFLLGVTFQLSGWFLGFMSNQEVGDYLQLTFQIIGLIYFLLYTIISLKKVFNKKYNIFLFFVVLLMSLLSFLIFFAAIGIILASLLGIL